MPRAPSSTPRSTRLRLVDSGWAAEGLSKTWGLHRGALEAEITTPFGRDAGPTNATAPRACMTEPSMPSEAASTKPSRLSQHNLWQDLVLSSAAAKAGQSVGYAAMLAHAMDK
jgi:hypothetical protein